MAMPLPPGLAHSEVAFLAEMELVTVVPRQRLESIDLLGGATPPLRPPHRTDLPLWLALLLKKQRRANIVPPHWLHPSSLSEIIHHETKVNPKAFSAPPPTPVRADTHNPGHAHRQGSGGGGAQQQQQQQEQLLLSAPFRASCTADAPAGYLPYHWLEVAESLLAHAGDDVASALGASAGEVRGLLRDLVEVRAAKMRSSTADLEEFGGGLMSMRGVGAVELAESRGFVLGVVDGVRKVGASAEAVRREKEEEEGEEGGGEEGESDEEMGIF
ncbi:GINS complex protein-domain-containing protein [Chaetomidium leptoderma]|uniref:DNA replication complex GINS protein PSF2 n=1 Tax=Chaetomidium leptoderma TaxID=669021 RepID=A0AAN6ZSF6_9PEZI|nr:GINS complex protein-domain-containing protein [Chaetomidium leptoderma]